MPRRPAVVLFDVVETLFSLAPVEAALAPLGLSVDLYFARLLRDGFALAAAGDYRAFAEIAASTLAALTTGATDDQRERVQRAFGALPPHPDAEPAFVKLAAAGVTVCTLTNGGAEATEGLLADSGLRRHVERVMTVEPTQRWKPSPEPYRQAVGSLGIEPHDTALVAVHSWDIHGANRAGLTTGWCSRLEGAYPSIFAPADVVGSDLCEVVDALLALPRDPGAAD